MSYPRLAKTQERRSKQTALRERHLRPSRLIVDETPHKFDFAHVAGVELRRDLLLLEGVWRLHPRQGQRVISGVGTGAAPGTRTRCLPPLRAILRQIMRATNIPKKKKCLIFSPNGLLTTVSSATPSRRMSREYTALRRTRSGGLMKGGR